MLTGRKEAFLYPYKYDEVSGYSEPQESAHDFFVIGHTSTSVSLASGQSVVELLKREAGIDATLINPRYITGVDEQLLNELKTDHQLVVTLEDGVLNGGFGEKITRYYGTTDMKVINFGAKKEFVDRFDVQDFLRANHLTAGQIKEDILRVL